MTSTTSDNQPFTNFNTPENSRFYATNVYQPLSEVGDDFRVLEILPGAPGDIIICKLIQSSLTSDLKYEALSYRAGDPNDVGQIVVNERSFNAFATLFTALSRLRYPDKSRFVWIDQICINQNNVVERNHQVRKMQRVYQRAEQVLAWLGSLAGGELAFKAVIAFSEDYLTREAQYKRSLEPHREFGRSDRRIIRNAIASEYAKELAKADQRGDNEHLTKVEALEQFFLTDFWNRMWIWQEIIVARSVRLLWDATSMDGQELFRSANVLNALENFSSSFKLSKSVRRLSRSVRLVAVIGRLRDSWLQDLPLNLHYLLRHVRHAKSSDLRDKIYAISGLISPSYNFVPNYTSPLDTVYCSTAWSIILADQSLDLLAFTSHPRRLIDVVLPSWCPDWSNHSGNSLRRKEMFPERVNHFFIPDLVNHRFDASKGVKISCRIQGMHGKSSALIAEGLHIDDIEEVCSNEQFDGVPRTERYPYVLEACRQLVGKKEKLTERLEDELNRTLMLDSSNLKQEMMSRTVLRLERDLVSAEKGRRFVLSRTNLMGMAPPHVQPGDLICVLLGASVPFLLRKTGTFYVLVGEVYISDGYMKGRAIDEMEVGTRSLESFEIH